MMSVLPVRFSAICEKLNSNIRADFKSQVEKYMSRVVFKHIVPRMKTPAKKTKNMLLTHAYADKYLRGDILFLDTPMLQEMHHFVAAGVSADKLTMVECDAANYKLMTAGNTSAQIHNSTIGDFLTETNRKFSLIDADYCKQYTQVLRDLPAIFDHVEDRAIIAFTFTLRNNARMRRKVLYHDHNVVVAAINNQINAHGYNCEWLYNYTYKPAMVTMALYIEKTTCGAKRKAVNGMTRCKAKQKKITDFMTRA